MQLKRRRHRARNESVIIEDQNSIESEIVTLGSSIPSSGQLSSNDDADRPERTRHVQTTQSNNTESFESGIVHQVDGVNMMCSTSTGNMVNEEQILPQEWMNPAYCINCQVMLKNNCLLPYSLQYPWQGYDGLWWYNTLPWNTYSDFVTSDLAFVEGLGC